MSDAEQSRPRPAQTPDADAARTRRLHDRTGEIELIISGALLLGLFQVPGYVDGWFDGARVRLGPDMFTGAMLVWIYVKLMVFTLIGSFSLHLVTRAYWVGLVGLDSAFPQGVTWDRIRYGPLAKRVYRERLSSLPVLARRADDFASSIFSFAFWTVLVFVLSIVLVGALGAGAYALTSTVLPGVSPSHIVAVAAMILGLIPLVAIGLDRALEGRIAEDGRLARAVQGVLALFYQVFGGPLFMPIQFTLFSNVRKKVIWPAYIGVFVLLFAAFYANLVLGSGLFVLSSSDVLPTRPGVRSVDARYYEDQSGGTLADPSIQSDVIEGPYVRLTVPFVARRDVERIEALCPDLDRLGRVGLVRSSAGDEPPDAGGMDRTLACLGGLWRVSLDGVPLSPEWDFRSAPGSGVTGLVAYLPTEGMEPGAHVLELEAVPVPADEAGPAGEAGAGEEAGAVGEPASSGDDEPSVRRHYIRFRR